MADSQTTATTMQQQQAVSPPMAAAPAASVSSPTLAGAGGRRGSDEWDASKVPPSRFQKRKGSIYAVPGSRDGHVDSNYAAKFHELHSEKYKK